MPDPNDPLDNDLRKRIDALDLEIMQRLADRAALMPDVAAAKRRDGKPLYDPDREQAMLDRLAKAPLGDFPLASARAILREIISACLALQQPLKIACLGPAGTFTELAARSLYGDGADYLPQPNFAAVLEQVSKHRADIGVVPVENSTAGTIRDVLDLLASTRLTIVREAYQAVHHFLLAAPIDGQPPALSTIRAVYSKDTALDQCKEWLRANVPAAQTISVASTAEGARLAAGEAGAAAIAPERAGQVYQLATLAANIEDRADNRTRFFALGHEMPAPSAADKTSLIVAVPHEPGTLVRALDVLRRYELNMTLIESRPSPFAAFEYVFYLDFEGHVATPRVAEALKELASVCLMTQVLGSYPRATD